MRTETGANADGTSMHVVLLNDFAFANGGAGQVALADAIALSKEGCAVTFFAAVGPPAPELAASAINVIVLDQKEIAEDPSRMRAAAQGLWNMEAGRKLSLLLSGLNPSDTVVHVHSISKALSASAVHAALESGFRVVCTLHDYFAACPNGGFYDYRTQEICTLKPLSRPCLLRNCDRRNYSHKLWRVARHWLSDVYGGFPAKLSGFFYSTELSMRVLQPYLPPNTFVQKMLNPIDVQQLPPANPESHEKFVAVGRIVPEKGFDLLVKAANSISAPVKIVGEGEDRKSILSLSPSTEITGWIAHENALTELRNSRALVFPSLLYETQGLAVWEAASQGIPSIVADTTAAVEGVRDGATGLHFKGGDWQDLAEKMRILQDPQIAQRMGRAAYDEYWRNPMTPKRHARELMASYEIILRDRP